MKKIAARLDKLEFNIVQDYGCTKHTKIIIEIFFRGHQNSNCGNL